MSDAVDERDLQMGRARVVETGGLAAYYADLDRHETGALWTRSEEHTSELQSH